jgi:formate-dependent nitrite reductase cytochrome c552 subunit
MIRKNFPFQLVLVLTLFCAGVAYAQTKPARKGGGMHHPNLVAAHRLCLRAIEKIDAAQKANELDMEGHAKKAKELLEQAEKELKQAAEEATENRGKKEKSGSK